MRTKSVSSSVAVPTSLAKINLRIDVLTRFRDALQTEIELIKKKRERPHLRTGRPRRGPR
jgi:hypothetical protein